MLFRGFSLLGCYIEALSCHPRSVLVGEPCLNILMLMTISRLYNYDGNLVYKVPNNLSPASPKPGKI